MTTDKWEQESKLMTRAAAEIRNERMSRRRPTWLALADALDAMAAAGTGYRGKARTALVKVARTHLGEDT